MAILFPVKVVLVSTSVLSMAMVLNFSAPLISEFVVSDIPSMYRNLIGLLRPPYLYLLINCIIISIVASSKYQTKSVPVKDPYSSDTAAVESAPSKMAEDVRSDFVGVYDDIDVKYEEKDGVSVGEVDKKDEGANVFDMVEKEKKVDKKDEIVLVDGGDEGRRSVEASLRGDSMEFPFLDLKEKEKPPVSARFGQRKALKLISEGSGKPLRVTRPKRQDTLESTWKAITEGRSMPLTRHLKKSDTFESHARPPKDQNSNIVHIDSHKMKKSETFSDSKTASKKSSLRREPSPSQDELNKRVEAFINKFNEEMRLQRQQSLNQYREMMIKRGAQ